MAYVQVELYGNLIIYKEKIYDLVNHNYEIKNPNYGILSPYYEVEHFN